MVYRYISPVFSLLCSFIILCFGHGLQSVLLPARATMEQFSEIMAGLLMSAYYGGFIIGTYVCPKLISRVGHIRVFAAAAAAASSVMLVHVLVVEPVIWLLLRVVYGLAMVHLFTVMESWLNTVVERENRGRMLSIYMITNFLGMTIGQLLFFVRSAYGFELFAMAAVFLSLSLLPLILSRIHQPMEVTSPEAFGLKQLMEVSPLGVVGALTAGLVGSAYWGLSAMYILKAGYPENSIAVFMASSFLGGLAAQWPLGLASDRIGRRIVIIVAASFLALASTGLMLMSFWDNPAESFGTLPLVGVGILLGTGLHPLYSLCIAHTNDFVPGNHFVRASTGLQLVQSIGAVSGPMLVGVAMSVGGYGMLFGYIACLSGMLILYTLWRVAKGNQPSNFKPFHIFTRLGMPALRMDPRARENGVGSDTTS